MNPASPNDNGPSPAEEPTPACPNCLAGNGPAAHFCTACGAPLTTYATTAPLERVYATGYVYRTAVSERIPFIAALGMWLIFVPQTVCAVAFLFGVLSTPLAPHENWDAVLTGYAVPMAYFAAMLAVYVALLVRVTRNYCRSRASENATKGENEGDTHLLVEDR